ncbi:MAG: nucleotidyltransferase family protein [Patescibacteria group bacterium]
MKAVILAAGRGSRMMPLSLVKPKPLIKVAGKPLIRHIVEKLPKEVDELILVVGYLQEQIRAYCGEEFCGRKVVYVEQKEQLGTGHALELCKDYLGDERFFVLCADDLHGAEDFASCLKHDLCLLTDEREDPRRFAVISLRENGSVGEIIEKPEKPTSCLVSTGVMMLDKRIFNYKAKAAANGEYHLPTMLHLMAQEHPVAVERARLWYPIASIEDLKGAEKVLS